MLGKEKTQEKQTKTTMKQTIRKAKENAPVITQSIHVKDKGEVDQNGIDANKG